MCQIISFSGLSTHLNFFYLLIQFNVLMTSGIIWHLYCINCVHFMLHFLLENVVGYNIFNENKWFLSMLTNVVLNIWRDCLMCSVYLYTSYIVHHIQRYASVPTNIFSNLIYNCASGWLLLCRGILFSFAYTIYFHTYIFLIRNVCPQQIRVDINMSRTSLCTKRTNLFERGLQITFHGDIGIYVYFYFFFFFLLLLLFRFVCSAMVHNAICRIDGNHSVE